MYQFRIAMLEDRASWMENVAGIERRRIDVSLLLTALTVFGMLMAFLGRWLLEGEVADVMGAAGLVLVYLAAGVPVSWRAFQALWRERILDIDLLMIAAAIAAAAVGAPFEGAVLLTLFSISTTLEERALDRARHAIEALMALRPETALLRQPDGSVREVPVRALAAGDVFILRPGARVPVDGAILSGHGSLDEANITGESLPVSKGPGREVFEATVNLDGVIEARATRSVAESTVARMIELVTQAQAARAPSERFSAWFGQKYTIAVMAGALLAFAVFWWITGTWQEGLYRSAILLVAASPCAIVISVPAAILSALSASARNGVLFKGGGALETLATVNTFAFDKTGTLTTGKLAITRVIALDGDEAGLLSLLAGVEAQSEHHSARAIRAEARRRNLLPVEVEDAQALPSAGIIGNAGGHRIWAGNPGLAARMGADVGHPDLSHPEMAGQTIIYCGRDETVLGAVALADQLRPTSAPALSSLRAGGVERMVILTGDRHEVARKVGRELGFPLKDVHAELSPQEKVDRIATLASAGKVAFVGDGVNDAAALARADVGIAMGAAGSDVALQAADIALLSEDMQRLADAYRLALRTRRIVRQNLSLALGAMVVLVTGGLFFELPLPIAVIGHEGGTVLVVLNGLRLLRTPRGAPGWRLKPADGRSRRWSTRSIRQISAKP